MKFTGDKLRQILERQTEPVQVKDWSGELQYRQPRLVIAVMRHQDYYGIGNKRRIRFICAERREEQVVSWGRDLDWSPPKGAIRPSIERNRTSKGAKKWKPRPDNSQTGTAGSVIRIQIRESNSNALV